MTSQFVDAWQRNNEANLFILDQLNRKKLSCRYSERTRTVAAQFAHLHNVRIYHLQNRAKDLVGDLQTFERGAQPDKRTLCSALSKSEKAISQFLEKCEAGEKVKTWNRQPTTFLGYIIAHEAHHRALAIVSLRLSGEKLPKEVLYNIWNWGKKGKLK